MTNSDTIVELVDSLISDARQGLFALPEFQRKTDLGDVWYDLAFCIVSSQERTKRALTAAAALGAAYSRLRTTTEVATTIADVFDQEYISLRFINRKIDHLARSFIILHDKKDYILNIADNFGTAAHARNFLIDNFPGIGPKQASMFLRNIGYGSDLAIIDTHIDKMSRMLVPALYVAGTPNYLDLEVELRQYADSREVSLQTLDVILWSCSRLMGKHKLEEPLLV